MLGMLLGSVLFVIGPQTRRRKAEHGPVVSVLIFGLSCTLTKDVFTPVLWAGVILILGVDAGPEGGLGGSISL